MPDEVTDRDLRLILVICVLTIVTILLIVGRWLNFHLCACCCPCMRSKKSASVCEDVAQEPRTSFIDLNTTSDPLENTNDSSERTPVLGSVSSAFTNATAPDDAVMPNSNSAYEIVSYANNIKPTLKPTIVCDSDEESASTSLNDLYLSEENLGRGKLQTTINYNALEEYLEIVFIQVRYITVPKEIVEPVKLLIHAYLDDDRQQMQHTRLISYQNCQPAVFHSCMKWKVDDDHLPSTILHTSLHARGANKSDSLIGECSFTLGEIYIYQPLTTWLNLQDSHKACWYRGEISISLCYHPTADRLTCSLIQARNLTFYKREAIVTDTISTECYATISLLHRHQVRRKTRTSCHHATDRNPVFNETSVFTVSSNDLLTSYIRVVIYETIPSPLSATTKTFEIGHCLIGNHDRTQQMSHWQQMLRVLRRPVIVWHPLKL